MEQQLFSVRKAALIMGVSYTWTSQNVRSGTIKSVLLGGQRMISVEEITRIKEEGVKINGK